MPTRGSTPRLYGEKYLEICCVVKSIAQLMRAHEYFALKVWPIARTLGVSIEEFLICLKADGLAILPG